MNNRKDTFSIQLQINEKTKDEEIIESFVKDKRTDNIIIELSHKYEKTKVVITISKKWEKNNLYINDKIMDFAQKVNNNKKGYETFNVVPADGDSIYTADNKELATSEGGRVFISEDKIKDFVNQLIEQRLGPSLNNKDE